MITAFLPKSIDLFLKEDANGKQLPCPVPGMEDVWVRLKPLTVESESRLADARKRGMPDYDLFILEIYLTFAGTNMEVGMHKVDENGHIQWTTDADGAFVPDIETLKFAHDDSMTWPEFYAVASKLPSYPIVDAWHARVQDYIADLNPTPASQK